MEEIIKIELKEYDLWTLLVRAISNGIPWPEQFEAVLPANRVIAALKEEQRRQQMKEIKSVADIDTTTTEGRLLIVTLGRLNCQPGYDVKTPDEVLNEMSQVMASIW